MNHKRKRPKNRRAGCDCGGKVHKKNGEKGSKKALSIRDRRKID